MRREDKGNRQLRRSEGWGSLLFAVLLLLVLAPIVAHAQAAPDTVTLTWTAPGDDGRVGTATDYELRISTAPITAANWGQATIVPGTPRPLVAGTRQRMIVRGLANGTTYWLALKTVDDAGNWSDVSNVVRWDWIYDASPPAAPTGVAAVKQNGDIVRLTWAPNSEPDLAGYDVYRALSSGGPYEQINSALVIATQYVDEGLPAGTAHAYYQIAARDGSGNPSARSATATVTLVDQTSAWTMDTGYPNPSKTGTQVSIPIVVPGAGGSAVVDITTNAGLRVRRIDLGTLSPGPVTVHWDGRNDAGRDCAPGAYTAWLISGASRVSVRLVRVP
ncbi:MAG: hypothetical protein E6K81_13955 [Candidatus Eisenbacteria bacterium]|uniref:Fibronectin type-III domain-containing protein n=1 Tax=Eiseniibacteriota bacterium TaxID=2212470 RepID=A0A538U1U9_UNCEI|nr:MAG: hypothetical protein E6K81_13955 [Candidatus Eisenbacteria bacterium]